MNIDLSKFQKGDSDNKSTTLIHPSGHQLKIAHSGLSEEFRKQLEEMPTSFAKGGRAKFSQRFDPNIKASRASKPSMSDNKMPAADKYSEPDDQGLGRYGLPKLPLKPGEKIEPQGGSIRPSVISSSEKYPPCINPSCKSYGSPHPNCRCYGGTEQLYFAEGGEAKKEYYCDNDRPHFSGCEYFKAGGMSGDIGMEPADESGSQPVPSETPAPPQAQDAQTSAPAAAPLPSPNDVNPNPEMQSTSQSPADDTQDDQAQPTTQNQATPEAPTPIDEFQAAKSNAINELYPEAQAFKADLDNGHITPETYSSLFHDKGTLGKIGTIFGLMLSGAGSGLTHQPNMLLEMMNKQIDNDLKGQELSQQNKQNFLKINQQSLLTEAQSKNLTTEARQKAYALSRMQMNYAALHKLVSDTQKLPVGSPQRAQAEQTLAMMNQGVQNENFSIADRAATASALSKFVGGGQGAGANTTIMKSGLMGPEAKEVGEDIENKTYPELGRSSLPLSGADREQINSGLTFQRSLKNFIDWTSKHSGDLSPTDMKYGRALAAQLQGQYRMVTHGGVYKAGEQDFINKIISDNPTAFFNKVRNIPSLKAVQSDSSNQFDQLVKGKGFQGYKGAQSQGSSVPQYKTVNGVKYTRGANGEAVKVK